jgi:hypothetical protein
MHFHSTLILGSRCNSALARSIVASRLHLAAGVMPFLNHGPLLSQREAVTISSRALDSNEPVCPQAVAFDTAHKLKLLDARIENIEMSGPQTK